MNEISMVRLYAMRAMYLLMAVGLLLAVWPNIIFPPDLIAGPKSVIRAMLGALGLLSLLGLRYPLQMLPLLLFELLWKVIWVLASVLPMWQGPGLDGYASETLFECLIGIVLLPLVIPWRYVVAHYLKQPGAPWTNATPVQRPARAN